MFVCIYNVHAHISVVYLIWALIIFVIGVDSPTNVDSTVYVPDSSTDDPTDVDSTADVPDSTTEVDSISEGPTTDMDGMY